ncbi:hypothetical protein QVD17_41650 [Tagetes erecta]|uniref:Uncharacterized protein n=1 Tax=Tagetes erecta TaxID=13708 RepID=A0AAD8JMI2_TARER|nr:hypothetical protein QVD17_41650 [Tagetes erecta]
MKIVFNFNTDLVHTDAERLEILVVGFLLFFDMLFTRARMMDGEYESSTIVSANELIGFLIGMVRLLKK